MESVCTLDRCHAPYGLELLGSVSPAFLSFAPSVVTYVFLCTIPLLARPKRSWPVTRRSIDATAIQWIHRYEYNGDGEALRQRSSIQSWLRQS